MGSSYFVYELKLSLLHKISLFLCIKIPTIHLTPITCYYHVSVRMHIFPTMLTSEFNQLLRIGLWIRTNSRFAALKYFSKCVRNSFCPDSAHCCVQFVSVDVFTHHQNILSSSKNALQVSNCPRFFFPFRSRVLLSLIELFLNYGLAKNSPK